MGDVTIYFRNHPGLFKGIIQAITILYCEVIVVAVFLLEVVAMVELVTGTRWW